MIEKLILEISDILEVKYEEVESSTNFLDFQKFDSLAQIQIVAAIESLCGITIEPEQFEELQSLQSIINILDLK